MHAQPHTYIRWATHARFDDIPCCALYVGSNSICVYNVCARGAVDDGERNDGYNGDDEEVSAANGRTGQTTDADEVWKAGGYVRVPDAPPAFTNISQMSWQTLTWHTGHKYTAAVSTFCDMRTIHLNRLHKCVQLNPAIILFNNQTHTYTQTYLLLSWLLYWDSHTNWLLEHKV